MKKMILFIAVSLISLALSAETITYYVETTGSSENDGLSIENAFDSISTAIDSATAAYATDNANNDFIIEVGAGTFTESGLSISNVSVSINGQGANATILQGTETLSSTGKQVFTSSTNVVFTLNDLTVRNYGAAIGTSSGLALMDMRGTSQEVNANRVVFSNFTGTFGTLTALKNGNKVNFNECTFQDLTATNNTSCFLLFNGSATFKNCMFINCVREYTTNVTAFKGAVLSYENANASTIMVNFTNNTFIGCGIVNNGYTIAARQCVIFSKSNMTFTNNLMIESKAADATDFNDIVAYNGYTSPCSNNIFGSIAQTAFPLESNFISDTLTATSPEIDFVMDGTEIDFDTTATGLIYATAMGDSVVGQATDSTQTTFDITGTAREIPGCIGAVEYVEDPGGPVELISNQNEVIKLYPNPVQDILYIDGEISSLTLFNTSGQVVRTLSVQNGQVDLSSLAKGLYFAKCQSTADGNISIERIIKK